MSVCSNILAWDKMSTYANSSQAMSLCVKFCPGLTNSATVSTPSGGVGRGYRYGTLNMRPEVSSPV